MNVLISGRPICLCETGGGLVDAAMGLPKLAGAVFRKRLLF